MNTIAGRFNTLACTISCRKVMVSPPKLPDKKRYVSHITINSKQDKPVFQWKLPVVIPVGIFALGFIDAGYSGDWSRIGVISTETEDLLRTAAFLVVPVCIFTVISLSVKGDED